MSDQCSNTTRHLVFTRKWRKFVQFSPLNGHDTTRIRTMSESLTLMCPSFLPLFPPLSLLGDKKQVIIQKFYLHVSTVLCVQVLPFFSSPSFSSSFFTRFTFLWLAAFLRPPPCPSASSSESENSSSQAILLSWARTKTQEKMHAKFIPLFCCL